ncbi:hypothetical protein E4T56_gene18784 [Termitomyces sp. T112]|nr:hypothetical protein E4T56_gene18784 [Termitomyces sp. T112]
MSATPVPTRRILDEEELPVYFRRPQREIQPIYSGWRKRQMEMVDQYIPEELYLDQLPPWLINRNYPNTRFVPPILYFGFEITLPDEDDMITDILGSWDAINVHAGDKLVKICCIDANTYRRNATPPFATQEYIERLAQVLNRRPRLYIAMQRPYWEVREHYHAYI